MQQEVLPMTTQKYPNNKLTKVIFQIKFYPLLKLYSNNPEVASDFQQCIIEEFPETKMTQNRQVSLKIGSTITPVESETNNLHLIWNFKNENGKNINLTGEELTLTYPGQVYSTFDDFLNDIEMVIKGLKNYKIPKIKSIGLRYINQIKIDDNSKLNEYINPKLHLNNHSETGTLIQAISRIEYSIDEFLLSFQYGQFNPEYPNPNINKDFILDYDCIMRNDVAIDSLKNCLTKMNSIIYNKFEESINDSLRIEMGGNIHE